jgi:hypothetical protein
MTALQPTGRLAHWNLWWEPRSKELDAIEKFLKRWPIRLVLSPGHAKKTVVQMERNRNIGLSSTR